MAEFADIETLCADSLDKHLPQVMGILYRPIVEEHGEFYRIADYDGEDRSEFFQEMKMAHALGAAAFFLRTGNALVGRFAQLFHRRWRIQAIREIRMVRHVRPSRRGGHY